MPETFQSQIASISRTYYAFPAQWEGKLKDGRMFYIRYRHSRLTINVSPDATDKVDNAVCGPLILSVTTDDDDGGFMELPEVFAYAKNITVWG